MRSRMTALCQFSAFRIVVIGGLISATALTLILLPILYLRFAHAKTRANTETNNPGAPTAPAATELNHV